MALIGREMPVHRVAAVLGVNPQRVGAVFNPRIEKARQAEAPSAVTRPGVDETASRTGHHHRTLGVGMATPRVIRACAGKGTLKSIRQPLGSKGVPKEQVTRLSMDLSPAFIAGAAESFPAKAITFDRVHVVKLLNEAMDKVRRVERIEHDASKGHKYTFLKNRQHLSARKEKALSEMIELYPTLGKAYRLKMLFNDLWGMPNKTAATAFLNNGCSEVDVAKIPAFMAFVKTVKGPWPGIIHLVGSRITNGLLEGINSRVQLAQRRARGYRNSDNFINMIYFLCGKMKFDYPRYFT